MKKFEELKEQEIELLAKFGGAYCYLLNEYGNEFVEKILKLSKEAKKEVDTKEYIEKILKNSKKVENTEFKIRHIEGNGKENLLKVLKEMEVPEFVIKDIMKEIN